MKCPACSSELSAITYETGTAHLCMSEGCGGLWLKQREIKKLDDPKDSVGASVADQQRNAASKAVDHEKALRCPVCDDIVMRRHFYSVKKQAQVYECAGCGGMWLNAGELEKIRGEYATVEERDAATEKLLSGMIDPYRTAPKSQRKPT